MLLILLFLAFGIGIGFLLRKKKSVQTISSRFTNLFLALMIFSMGAMIGRNKTIVLNLKDLGIEALVLALGAIFGSIFLVNLIQKIFKAVDL